MHIATAIYPISPATLWLGLLAATLSGAASAMDAGAGLDVVSANVIRDSTRGGPSLQPSLWLHLPSLRSQIGIRSSVEFDGLHPDGIVADITTGTTIGSRAWLGLTARWSRFFSGDGHASARSLELGLAGSWFHPPYRPTLAAVVDVLASERVLAVVSVPYTVRLGVLPPLTVVPELGIDVPTGAADVSVRYLSLTALVEHNWSWFTFVPVVGIVPRGERIGDWTIWGGVHCGVSR